MKVKVGVNRRGNPMRGNGWGLRLSKIKADGEVTISDYTPNERFKKAAECGWIEITRDEFVSQTQRGGKFWIKTATFYGGARFYRKDDTEEVMAGFGDGLHAQGRGGKRR
jgi:hypothetical protein